MAKTKCVPCMSEALKKVVREFTNDPQTNSILETVATCPVGEILNLCQGKKRQPSAYQLFIGDCMRSKPIKGKPFGTASKYMKECSLEWRERSKKP